MHSINHQLVTLIENEQVQWVHVTVYSLKVGWRKNKTWTWTLPLALQEPNLKSKKYFTIKLNIANKNLKYNEVSKYLLVSKHTYKKCVWAKKRKTK